MKLEKDNIQFIDNYLTNSDVKHIDIRLEMVDHVATAIEAKIEAGDTREFYYIFKDYMVENKRRLLQNNTQFIKTATKKISNKIIIKYITPLHLLAMSLVGFMSYLSYTNLGFDFTKSIMFLGILFLILVPTIVYGIALKYYKYERISSTERINFFLIILVQLINLINILNNDFIAKHIQAIIMSVLFALLFNFVLSLSRVSHTLFKESKLQYQAILK